MRHLPLTFILLLPSAAFAETHVIDLSESHRKEAVTESGVEFTVTDPWISPEEGEDIRLVFPGGREIEFRVNRGDFRIQDDGEMSYASLYSELMPAEEAAEVMRSFKRSIGQSTEDVDRWMEEVDQGKHYQRLAFDPLSAGTGWNHYPAISLRAKSSLAPVYEWELSFYVQWTPDFFPEDWGEEKAAIHNPKPPEGLERISLNPPSGKFYSRKEAFEIDRERIISEMSSESKNVSQTEAESPVEPTPTERINESLPSETVEVIEQSTGEKSAPLIWPWIVGVLILLTALGLVLTRKKPRP